MPRMPEVVEIDPITGPGAEGARRATGGPGPVTGSRASDPDPEVPAKVERRLFSVNYFGRFASIVLAGSDHVDRYQQH